MPSTPAQRRRRAWRKARGITLPTPTPRYRPGKFKRSNLAKKARAIRG